MAATSRYVWVQDYTAATQPAPPLANRYTRVPTTRQYCSYTTSSPAGQPVYSCTNHKTILQLHNQLPRWPTGILVYQPQDNTAATQPAPPLANRYTRVPTTRQYCSYTTSSPAGQPVYSCTNHKTILQLHNQLPPLAGILVYQPQSI